MTGACRMAMEVLFVSMEVKSKEMKWKNYPAFPFSGEI
jgi:hypothetical protein